MWLVSKNTTLPEQVDFKNLTLPTSDYFLLVPAGFASTLSTPESPVFNCSVEVLDETWHAVIKKQARVKLRSFSKVKHRYHYLQKSLILQLPDFVIVQLIPLTENSSTIAFFSYSIYGLPDLSRNRIRVFKWLIDLKKQLNQQQSEI